MDFKTVEDAQRLLELEKIEINGRVIKLVPYAEKKKRGAKDDRESSSQTKSEHNESSGHSTDYNPREYSGQRPGIGKNQRGEEIPVKFPKASKKNQKQNPFTKKP